MVTVEKKWRFEFMNFNTSMLNTKEPSQIKEAIVICEHIRT